MTVFYLSKKGYGTILEIETWDTPRFLDAVEYESMIADIEEYQVKQANKGA